MVSKFIDGTDLATRLEQSRPQLDEAVELVATVAEALHHAHKQGLVHRDIKPGNILLDRTGKPFVADFGLALREQDVRKGPRYAGTPAYMSPEQARGEGHRVDGRGDIFSLGVVFYELLVDYAVDNPQVLVDLLMDADEKQFAVIYPVATSGALEAGKPTGEPLVATLIGTIDKKLPADIPSADERRETPAKRQANAAVALLRMNQPENVWPLLKHSPDPRPRSYLIHRLSPMGADAEALTKRLHEETDITIRRALLLSLGEFDEKELPPTSRTALLPKLQTIYRTDLDPGLHAAAEWLLRTWKQEAWLNQVNEAWAKDKEQRAKRLEGIPRQLKASGAASAPQIPPRWYINGQGQTMVVIPGPVEFVMGSPTSEAGRVPNETQHRRRIRRTFALAAKSVTSAEYQRFDPAYGTET